MIYGPHTSRASVIVLDMQPGSPSGHGVTLLWEALLREVNTQVLIPKPHSHKVKTAVLDRWHSGVPGSEARRESRVHSPLCLVAVSAFSGPAAADGW